MASIRSYKTSKGATRYRAEIVLKGHPRQTKSFHRLTDAKKWAIQTEAAIREGRYFPSAEAERHTLADAIERYKRDVLPRKPASIAQQGSQLDYWKAALGRRRLCDLTAPVLVKARDDLQAGDPDDPNSGIAPSTCNRYMAVLSHLFSVAVREWGWLNDNPLRKVSRLPEPRGRVRFLDKDSELPVLLEKCKESADPNLYDVVVLALCTGCRKQEILDLRWTDVDLQRGQIALLNTKNKERRSVPLSAKALEIMEHRFKTRRALHSLYVFPQPVNDSPIDIDRSFAAARDAAAEDVSSLEDFRFHDLRHTAASYLAMNGASVAEIAAVLGHKTLAMVQRYAHLSDAHTGAVVQRLGAALFPGDEGSDVSDG